MRRVNPYDRIELESRASYADTFYPTRKKEKISSGNHWPGIVYDNLRFLNFFDLLTTSAKFYWKSNATSKNLINESD
jgi:hypothetical protein